MKRRIIGLMLVALAVSLGWCMRPFDPDAWRTFARETKNDEQLRELYWDDEWPRTADRWHRYLGALHDGDREAFELAKRLCPVINRSAHPAEEFYESLSPGLERNPREVLELTKECLPSHPSFPCGAYDETFDKKQLDAAYKRRRAAVSELLDGGLSEIAAACLEEMK